MSIEERLASLEKRVQKLEDSTAVRTPSASSKTADTEALIVSKVDSIETQDLIVIALRLTPRQTKNQVKAVLNDWGANVGSWFEGGNLNSRMVAKGLVKKEEAKEGILFSLTKKGELLADQILNSLNKAED